MMRHLTDEEIELSEKFSDPNTTEEEKKKISQRLKEIDREITKNCPFQYD
ncbi:MAG: hypothetical protein U0M12_05965 [Acutalibacteraceae bacterium]|nr:hypothetical protein [Acutalibacteraceae bacterium]